MRSMVEGKCGAVVQDMPRHIVEIAQNVRRLDPQNINSQCAQPSISPLVVSDACNEIMAGSVDLNGKPHRGEIEVQHIRPNRMLPPKFQAVRPLSEPLPQRDFRG